MGDSTAEWPQQRSFSSCATDRYASRHSIGPRTRLHTAQTIITDSNWIPFYDENTDERIRAMTYVSRAFMSAHDVSMVTRHASRCLVPLRVDGVYVLNVYNGPEDTHTIDHLSDTFSTETFRSALIAGDFNLHHPLWQPKWRLQIPETTENFVDWLVQNDLVLQSPPGIATHTRGNVLDLMFATSNLDHMVEFDSAAFLESDTQDYLSDHKALTWRINRRPERAFLNLIMKTDRYNYNQLDEDALTTALECGIPRPRSRAFI